jgi:N-acetylglutamate synthase-like GNAT family acetyltransferase
MKEPEIRMANHRDIPAIVSLIREAFRTVANQFGLTLENCPKHPSNCTEEWVQKDFDRGVEYFVLFENDSPKGCVAAEKAEADLCYLERLAVSPSERGRGLGRRLAEHACREARKKGARRIGIGIIAADAWLNRWYRRMGFVEGETKAFPHLPFEVAFLTRDLSPGASP